jgi:hypothetical protein
VEQEFFDSFYKNQYERLADSFNRRGNRYRYLTRLHQVTLLASSAITPVIIALSDSNHLKILAIALSSLVAILSGHGGICPGPGHCVQDATVRFRAEGPSAPNRPAVVFPLPACVSADPDGDWHAETCHSVEHVAPDFCLGPLIG